MGYLALNLLVKSDWITGVFSLIFLLLGIVKYLYNDRLVELTTLFFTNRYFLNYAKESRLIFNGFNVILFAVQIIILSLFIFLLVQFYFIEFYFENDLLFFIKINIGILIFFLIRFLVGYLLALLFEIGQEQKQVTFSKMSYLFALSILILPFLLLVFYVKNFNLLLFQLLSLLLTILLIMRYVFVLKNNKSVVLSRLFYFILYLCALEIAPMLLIFKIIK